MMRRFRIICRLSAALIIFLGSAGPAFAQAVGDGSGPGGHRDEYRGPGSRHKEKGRQPVQLEVRTVCANDVPRGWVQTGDRWDPMTCGRPTGIIYNVWTIERYRGRPVGAVMQVCSGQVPRGWEVLGATWNPNTCGHPAAMIKNVMTIKKIE